MDALNGFSPGWRAARTTAWPLFFADDAQKFGRAARVEGLENLVLLQRSPLVSVGVMQESQTVAGQREVRSYLDGPLEGVRGKLVLTELHIAVAHVESIVGVEMRHLIVVVNRLAKSFECAGTLAEFRARITEHVGGRPSLLGLGLEPERLLEGRHRLVVLPHARVSDARAEDSRRGSSARA